MASLKEVGAFLVFLIAVIWAASVGGILYALFIVLLAAVYVYLDAKKRGIGPVSGEKQELGSLNTWSPGTWAILTLLFWIIFFPLYLIKRDAIAGR